MSVTVCMMTAGREPAVTALTAAADAHVADPVTAADADGEPAGHQRAGDYDGNNGGLSWWRWKSAYATCSLIAADAAATSSEAAGL